nr:efflux RND transporter periplasmic adaptor subunit [Oceanococcus sp. HetDA_MAG_MS8]
MYERLRSLSWVGFWTLSLLLVHGLAHAQSGRALPVKVAAVAESSWAREVQVTGTIEAVDSVRLAPTVTERVTKVHFQEGAKVAAGEILVELEQAQEQAQLALAKARLREADLAVKRAASLQRQKLLADAGLDEALVGQAVAQAEVDAAQAALNERILRAPFAGQVGLRQVSPGAIVESGTIITQLHSVDALRVSFSLPQTEWLLLSQPHEVQVEVAGLAGQSWTGQIDADAVALETQSRALPLRAQIRDAAPPLRPGLAATVTVRSQPHRSLSVPEAALLPRGGQQFVYVVDEQDQAQRRKVRIGLRKPGTVEVLDGLTAGEKVVVRGAERLRPGMTVLASQWSPEA